MVRVVRQQQKTTTKQDPSDPNKQITTTEITKHLEDGSIKKSVETITTYRDESSSQLSHHSDKMKNKLLSSLMKGRKPISSSQEASREQAVLPIRKLCNLGLNDSAMTSPVIKKDNSTNNNSPVVSASEFEQVCIRSHNELRAKHKVPLLTRSEKLSKNAMQWAERLAREDRMYHNTNSDYGENIFCKWSSNPNHQVDGNEPVQSWYKEIANYKFGSEPSPCTRNIGHFTQLVWMTSQKVGVAQARSKSGKVYVVANYFPAGNFLGIYSDNVPPVGGHPTNHKSSQQKNSQAQVPSFRPPTMTSKQYNGAVASNRDETTSTSDAQKYGSNLWRANFMQQCVERHNHLRAKHQASPLRLDSKLCKLSQEWAANLAARNTMQHRPNNNYGENLFCVSNTAKDPLICMSGDEPVDNWYSEVKDYNFQNQSRLNIGQVGHFSQVVWKNSTKIGIGVAKSEDGKVFVVANYDPAGNFIGQFQENVQKRR